MRWTALLMAAAVLAGCHTRTSGNLPPASPLLQDFGTLLEIDDPHLHPAGGSTNEEESWAQGRTRSFDWSYEVRDSAFDEQRFTDRLQGRLLHRAQTMGLQPGRAARQDHGFSFAYSAGTVQGRVQVRTARLPGNQYRLWAEIHEPAPAEHGTQRR